MVRPHQSDSGPVDDISPESIIGICRRRQFIREHGNIDICDFPDLPLLFMILSPNGVKNEMNKTGWHLCFCLGNLTILMLACGQLVLTNLMR